MKRCFAILLTLTLCLSLLAGCGTSTTPETKAPATEAPISQAPATEAPEVTTPPAGEQGFDLEAFLRELAAAHPEADTEALCRLVLESPYFTMFSLESTEFYYPGFNWEYQVHDVHAAHCVVDYMSGSGALVYAIEPEAGADPEALAQELAENLDQNWMYADNGPDSQAALVLNGKIFLALYRADMQPVEGPIAETARDFVELFHARRAEHPEEDCLALADYFLAHQKLTQMYTEAVVPGSLTGFANFEAEEPVEVTGFAEGAMFNPMMSPSTFIGYVFRLEEGADQEAFIAQLREKANLAWNVCVAANTILTEADGNYVLFMMCTE